MFTPARDAELYIHRSDQDLVSLAAAIDAGPLSGLAEVVTTYERVLAARFGAPAAVAVSSGSAALHTALHVARERAGRAGAGEVVVPAMAPLPTLLPILAAGLVPRFVDVCPDRLEFDGDDLATALAEGPVAVLTVSLWGYPFDLRPHLAMVRSRPDLLVVEDAAQAHGTLLGGAQVGTSADLACFSTHDRKTLSTGEGGFLLGRDAELLADVRRFSRLGGLTGTDVGLNYKLNGLAAALGLARIPDIDPIVTRRRDHAAVILRALRPEWGITELAYPSDAAPNYYTLALATRRDGAAFAQRLNALGLATDPIRWRYRVGYRHPLFQKWARPCPGAEHLVVNTHQIAVDPRSSTDLLAAAVRTLEAAAGGVPR
jgi:dTDP-4-amino-4,6-dideoxygalactose transaminase